VLAHTFLGNDRRQRNVVSGIVFLEVALSTLLSRSVRELGHTRVPQP
jgi:hypothetical protein